MSGRYRIVGIELSPYTVKVRAVMRYRMIPHIWQCRFPQFLDEFKDIKPLLMPAVEYPDGSIHIDSTAIIDDLEATCERNRNLRKSEVAAARKIVQQQTERFMHDVYHRATGPVVQQLREQLISISESELGILFETELKRVVEFPWHVSLRKHELETRRV